MIASSFCSTDFSCIFKWRTSLSSLLSEHDVMVTMTKNVIAKHKYPSRNRSLSSKALMFCYGKYFIATIAEPTIPMNRSVRVLVRPLCSAANFKSKDSLRCSISLCKELISSLVAKLSVTIIRTSTCASICIFGMSAFSYRFITVNALKAVAVMRNPFQKSSPYPKYRLMAAVYQ